jgi:gas vesicle protein
VADGMDNVGKVLLGFGFGMIAGGVAALLLAPAGGRETRRRIGRFAQDVSDQAREGVAEVTQFVSDQKDSLKIGMSEGQHAYERESVARAGRSRKSHDGSSA